MNSTLLNTILQSIYTNNYIAFYYNNDTDHLIYCYPIFIHSQSNKLISIFSKADLDLIKNKVNNDSIASIHEFEYTEQIDDTKLYSFDLDKIIEFTDYGENAWDKYSSCEGCRYGLSNQQGHMDFGGCMYTEEY